MVHNSKLIHVFLVVKYLCSQCLFPFGQLRLVHLRPWLKFLNLCLELINDRVLQFHVFLYDLLLLLHFLSFLFHECFHLSVELLLLFLHSIVLLLKLNCIFRGLGLDLSDVRFLFLVVLHRLRVELSQTLDLLLIFHLLGLKLSILCEQFFLFLFNLLYLFLVIFHVSVGVMDLFN